MTYAGDGSFVFSQLARDLYLMGPALRRSMRQQITASAGGLLSDARNRAGWSTRIPGAIDVKPVVSDAREEVGLELRVRVSPEVPHARAYEGMGQGGTFRHPVFGDREVWVAQATRPYAWPAVLAHRDEIEAALLAAYEEAARSVGFR